MFAKWWKVGFMKDRLSVRHGKAARRSTLEVESLEIRLVPANIFVHNFNDGAVAALTPLPGSGNFLAPNLRSAVFHHNDFVGASSILLDTTKNAATTYKLSNTFGGQLNIAYSGG